MLSIINYYSSKEHQQYPVLQVAALDALMVLIFYSTIVKGRNGSAGHSAKMMSGLAIIGLVGVAIHLANYFPTRSSPQTPRNEIPFISGPFELSKFADEEYKGGGNTKGILIKLNDDYTLYKIRGDGHCLFRAVATGLLFSFAIATAQTKGKIIERLKSDERLSRFLETPDLDVMKTLTNEEDSNAWVRSLRNRVCGYLKMNPTDTFSAYVASENKTIDQYLNEMNAMERAEMGAEPELQALADVLGLTLKVVDTVRGDHRSCIGYTKYSPSLPLDNGMTVTLLFRTGHYDYLHRKK